MRFTSFLGDWETSHFTTNATNNQFKALILLRKKQTFAQSKKRHGPIFSSNFVSLLGPISHLASSHPSTYPK